MLLTILPLTVGGLSGYLAKAADRTTYNQLIKPSFNPPSWIFGPVWIVLYLVMGISAEMVKSDPKALQIFFIQLALNFAWSLIFFNLQRRDLAFLVIILLLISIVYMIKVFSNTSPLAAKLQIPYLLWVSFATILNISIWWLNDRY
jgi:benzodiazapine receptor